MKTFLQLAICFLTIPAFLFGQASGAAHSTNDNGEIEAVIKGMYTNDYSQIYHSKDVLLNLSAKAPEERSLIIKRLMAEESKLHEPLMKAEDYNYWYGLVLTLGSLKATEAIDVLAGEISRGDIFNSTTLEKSNPAAFALLNIGKPALPALRQIFQSSSAKTRERYLATIVMIKIGDSEDVKFFKERLKTEKDPAVRTLLKELDRGEFDHYH